MANSSQTSRRNFLSTLAILSAGAALGSARTILSGREPSTDLNLQWKSFYSSNGGRLFHKTIHSPDKVQINTCSGHVHKTGQAIFFPDENLVAEPTWIYWGADKKDPADIIVTFFKNDGEKTKVFRINRFELEGLNELSSGVQHERIIKLMNQDAQMAKSAENHVRRMQIKTLIKKDQSLYLSATYRKKNITIERKFIYQS